MNFKMQCKFRFMNLSSKTVGKLFLVHKKGYKTRESFTDYGHSYEIENLMGVATKYGSQFFL